MPVGLPGYGYGMHPHPASAYPYQPQPREMGPPNNFWGLPATVFRAVDVGQPTRSMAVWTPSDGSGGANVICGCSDGSLQLIRNVNHTSASASAAAAGLSASCGMGNGSLHAADSNPNQGVVTLGHMQGPVLSIGFASNNAYLLTGSNCELRVWDLAIIANELRKMAQEGSS